MANRGTARRASMCAAAVPSAAMFSATYLGHQGWLVQTRYSRILVDPLLTDEYSPGFEAEIYPPRVFDVRQFPAIDAVVRQHDHADHVNLPSLAMLARDVPIVM